MELKEILMPTLGLCHFHRLAQISLISLTALGSVAETSKAQHKTSAAPEWRSDFTAARIEASQGNKLLLVCFNMDDEAANDRAVEGIFRNAKFLRALTNVVPVIASRYDHDSGHSPCHRFGHLTCEQHKATEMAARKWLFGELRSIIAPQYILLYPNGTVAWHHTYECSASQISIAIQKAKPMCKSVKRQASSQKSLLSKFSSSARRDKAAFHRTRTAFALARPEDAGFLMRSVKGPKEFHQRLLQDIVNLYGNRAIAMLTTLAKDRNKTVARLAADPLLSLQLKNAEVVSTALEPGNGLGIAPVSRN